MLLKTPSGEDRQIIKPATWTLVRFAGEVLMPLQPDGWTLTEVTLRVEYPSYPACPRTLRGRFVRRPLTPRADETGHDDKNPVPGLTRHHHWQHFLKNSTGLTLGFKVWHDGSAPIVLDGRQLKAVAVTVTGP